MDVSEKKWQSQLFFHPQVSFLAVLKAKNELQANKSSLKTFSSCAAVHYLRYFIKQSLLWCQKEY